MDNMEQKLGTILGNPKMMEQIQAMAQSLTGSPDTEPQDGSSPDLSVLGNLGGLGIDGNQQALLSALTPYLPGDRVKRLEKAMRAAKMARAASAFLGSGGLQTLSGR